tara:strand:- start:3334 stop:3531 length:198 start_codon:yes stop_codon:yes gene_type:complete
LSFRKERIKPVGDITVLPPYWIILFCLPLLGAYLIGSKTINMPIAAGFYIIGQIALTITAKLIYS